MDKIQKECTEIKEYKNKKRDLRLWGLVIGVLVVCFIIGCLGYALKGEADYDIGKYLVTHENCMRLTSDDIKRAAQEECDRAGVYSSGTPIRNYCNWAKWQVSDYFEDWIIVNPVVWIYGGLSFISYWLISMFFQFSGRAILFGVFRRIMGIGISPV